MFIYYLIILAVFFLVGFLFGKLCSKIGFIGLEGFFWFRGSTSLMAFLGLIFLVLMIFFTRFLFPVAMFLLVLGFFRGISKKNQGFGENLEAIADYEIVRVEEKTRAEPEINGQMNKHFRKKRQADSSQIKWPDIEEL